MRATLVVRLGEKEEPLHAARMGLRGKRFSEGVELPADEVSLSGKRVLVLWDVKGIHFFRDQVFTGPEEVMALQVQEKVERTGLFRAPPSVFYHVDRREGNTAQVGIAAMDTSAMEARLDTLWDRKARIQGVYHPALAVAFLAAHSGAEKTLTVWIREQGFFLVATEGARVQSLRFVPFDDFTGPSGELVRQEVAFARERLEGLPGQGVPVVRSCGPLRHLLPEADVPWPEECIPGPLQPIAFSHPEWFGAFFVPSAFDMLPEKARVWVRHMPWAVRAGALLLAVSVGQLGMWAFWKHKTVELEKETRSRMRVVASRADSVQKAVPWDRLSVVEEYRKTLEAFQKEPRMDEWVVWLAETVPENFRVVRCTVAKKGESGSAAVTTPQGRPIRRRGADMGSEEASAGLTLSLEVKGTVGFQEAQRSFGTFLAALKERRDVRAAHFHYDEKSGQAVFSFEIDL